MLNITNQQKMQTETTIRYQLINIRMATIWGKKMNEKKKITSVGKNVRKLEPLYAFGGIIYSVFWSLNHGKQDSP